MSKKHIFTFESDKPIALVTGATGAIGQAISQVLHDMGAHIALSGTNQEKLTHLHSTLENSSVFQCDLHNPQDCSTLVQRVKDQLGSIDILICNAGINKDKFCISMSDDDFSAVLKLNLESTFILNRETVKSMLRNKQKGRIINISSVVAYAGNAAQANYCASKAGMIGMTKSIAKEVAHKGITINSIAPGFTESAMTKRLPDTVKEKILSHIPMQKMAVPQDVAYGCAYLASKQAGYITGATLHINGGMLMT